MTRCIAAAVLIAATIPAGASASAGRIAYSRYTEDFEAMNIVVSDGDGRHATQLTDESKGVKDYDPEWSPDGRRIVFHRETEQDAKLVIVRASGRHQRVLDTGCTGNCDADLSPSWTPDGRIAYTRVVGPYDRPNESARSAVLWTVRADGSHRRRLSQRGIDGRFEDYYANWSADGSFIQFLRIRNEPFNSALFRMRPDGTHVRRLTPWKLDADLADLSHGRLVFETYGHGGQAQNVATIPTRCRRCRIHYVTHNQPKSRAANYNPSWSPDGRRIVMVGVTNSSSEDADDGVAADLFSVRPDGSDRRNLTRTDDLFELRPDWAAAPARASVAALRGKLVYAKELDSGFQLFTSRADGTAERQITHVTGAAQSPGWSPDGRRVVFEYDYPTDKGCSIAFVDADGGHLTNLGRAPRTCDNQPAYRPDGKRVVYVHYDDKANTETLTTVKPDGSARREISMRVKLGVADPNYAPNGRHITFVQLKKEDELQALISIRADGSDFKRLTPYTWEVAIKHDWSPNGRTIVITRQHDVTGAPAEALLIRPDGKLIRRLARNAYVGGFSPDGQSIVMRIERQHGEEGRLVVMDPKGRHRRAITAWTDLRPRFIDWGVR